MPNNLPSICDGLLPVQRKVITALYNDGVTHEKPFKKMLICSAMAMKFYVFGDLPLTAAMKNMGSNALNFEYLDPKGSYPDKNRKDGVGASPRYIECRLTKYSEMLLNGIKEKCVPFVPNWDSTTEEPVYLPSPIPNMLINPSQSIAVGFASKIPAHNLTEVCDSFINYIETADINKSIDLIKGCDSPLGANVIYDQNEFRKILTTGQGSYQMIAKWEYDKKKNMILITEIPYDTTIEDIDDKIRLAIEKGKIKEISDLHDGSDKNGLKYYIYLKRGTDINKLIEKLRKYTPFQCGVSVNLYMLQKDGITPKLYCLKDIIEEWTEHRIECIKKKLLYNKKELENKLSRMEGLIRISNRLDDARKILLNAKSTKQVISDLTKEFSLTNEQAEYIKTIHLIDFNTEWINKQTKEYQSIQNKIKQIEVQLADDKQIKKIIVQELNEAKTTYGKPRKTQVLYDVEKNAKVDAIEDYSCSIILTEQGYVKKILKNSDNQKLKDGDRVLDIYETTNMSNILVFTDKANMYTVRVRSISECVPSSLGQYLPAFIGLEPDENIKATTVPESYNETVLFVFENGKVARVSLQTYKTNQKKISKAFNTESKLVSILFNNNPDHVVVLESSDNRRVEYKIKDIRTQKNKMSKGVQIMKLKQDAIVRYADDQPFCNNLYLIKSAGYGKKITGA